MGLKATYIHVGPDLQWGPGQCPGRGSEDEVNWYTNFDVLENEYAKMDLSCTAISIKNVTCAFLRAESFRVPKA